VERRPVSPRDQVSVCLGSPQGVFLFVFFFFFFFGAAAMAKRPSKVFEHLSKCVGCTA
jgi:hypothetical protein